MNKKGIDKERDLVNFLEFNGIPALRVAGSGGGTKLDRPDIIASDGKKVYCIELKSSDGNYIYIDQNQVKELVRFSTRFNGMPVVAVKFNYLPYCFMSINDLNCTNKGNYKITRDKAKRFKNRLILKS